MPENPKNPEQKINPILSLSKRYGGLDKIPDSELGQAGYKRLNPDLIVTMGFNPPEQSTKIKPGPFEEISIPISRKDSSFRRLEDKQIVIFGRKFAEIERSLDIVNLNGIEEVIDENIPSNYPIKTFAREFMGFVDSSKDIPELKEYGRSIILNSIFYWSTFIELVNPLMDFSADKDKFISDFQEIDDNGKVVISTDNSERMYSVLEKLKGSFGDRMELDKIFATNQQNDFIKCLHLDEIDDSGLTKYAKTHNLTTNYSASNHFFGLFLKSQNMHEITTKLANTKSSDETIIVLETERNNILNKFIEEEKKLKAKIKSSSIEEKKSISGQLKEVRDMRDKNRNIIDGMIQYYKFPEIAAYIINKKIQELQNFLVGEKKGEADVTLLLNGQPDPELDQDPGIVSGDCTAGKPLPFAEPTIPVHNIKVFINQGKEKNHVGNIYLLQTQNASGEPVWHLDAIQIPESRIEWSNDLPLLVEKLAGEAQKKQVAMITTNYYLPNISNYDYIGKAVDEYWKKQGGIETNIDIPSIDPENDRYSSFQGSGKAKVLWTSKA